MPTTPAGPTLSSELDTNGDPIVLTGSGMAITPQHLEVLDAVAGTRREARRARKKYPTQVRELQRDRMLSTGFRPTPLRYGYDALLLAGWK